MITDPYSVIATALEQVIAMEFTDETYLEFKYDRIHESLGFDKRTHVAVSPEGELTGGVDLTVEVLLQWYGPYSPDVDPNQQVDPRVITQKAERLRRAISTVRVSAGNDHVWYFDVVRTSYPIDPTGNKSRFEMTIVGRGQNSGLVETTG